MVLAKITQTHLIYPSNHRHLAKEGGSRQSSNESPPVLSIKTAKQTSKSIYNEKRIQLEKAFNANLSDIKTTMGEHRIHDLTGAQYVNQFVTLQKKISRRITQLRENLYAISELYSSSNNEADDEAENIAAAYHVLSKKLNDITDKVEIFKHQQEILTIEARIITNAKNRLNSIQKNTDRQSTKEQCGCLFQLLKDIQSIAIKSHSMKKRICHLKYNIALTRIDILLNHFSNKQFDSSLECRAAFLHLKTLSRDIGKLSGLLKKYKNQHTFKPNCAQELQTREEAVEYQIEALKLTMHQQRFIEIKEEYGPSKITNPRQNDNYRCHLSLLLKQMDGSLKQKRPEHHLPEDLQRQQSELIEQVRSVINVI